MPFVRLRIQNDWFKLIKSQAQRSNKKVEQFVLDMLAAACPPPYKTSPLEDEPVVRDAQLLCAELERTKRELLQAIATLRPDPTTVRANPRVAAKRRRSSALLQRALKNRSLRQKDLVEHLGVTAQAVSAVVNGRESLPLAWSSALAELLGEGWMSE